MNRKKQFKVYVSNNSINKNKSTNPLVHLKYRQLQELAIKLMLPANIKYKPLLALIIARTSNREDIVEIITQEVWKGKKSKLVVYKNKEKLCNLPTETGREETSFQKGSTEFSQNAYHEPNYLFPESVGNCSNNENDTNYIEMINNNFGCSSQNYSDMSEVNINLNMDQADQNVNFGDYL